jgi:hypothetical protein
MAFFAAINGRNCGIVADDQLPAQGFAAQLSTVILDELPLERRDSFRRDATLSE